MTAAVQDTRRTRTRRTVETPPDRPVRHGTLTGYSRGCGCDPCLDAKLAYNSSRRRLVAYGRWQSRIDATGTRRRAQALLTLGYPYSYQAEQIGYDRNDYTKMLRSYPTVRAKTAHAVAGLYERLWDTPASDSWSSRKARRLAARMGYPPPLAWDDDTIDDPDALPQGVDFGKHDKGPDWVLVERTCSGEHHLWADLCADDKREVVARLLAAPYRWTQTQIGRYLHQSGSTIVRYLPASEVAA